MGRVQKINSSNAVARRAALVNLLRRGFLLCNGRKRRDPQLRLQIGRGGSVDCCGSDEGEQRAESWRRLGRDTLDQKPPWQATTAAHSTHMCARQTNSTIRKATRYTQCLEPNGGISAQYDKCLLLTGCSVANRLQSRIREVRNRTTWAIEDAVR